MEQTHRLHPVPTHPSSTPGLKGDAAGYADWSFILKAYLSCLDSKFLDFIQKIETSTVNLPNRVLSETEKALSCQLYFVLVMLLGGWTTL